MSRRSPRGLAPWLLAGALVACGLGPLSARAAEPQAPTPSVPRTAPPSPTSGQGRREAPGRPATGVVPQEDPTVPTPPSRACGVDPRFSELWPRVRDVAFHPTTLEERAAFAKLIPALLTAAPKQQELPPGLGAVAASVGFRLEVWRTPKDTFWVLREQAGRYHGAGAYVVRTGKATDDVVQVPHPYYDVGTEDLGAGLFACPPEGRAPRLFMTATGHRYHGSPDETPEDPEHPADVAHNPEHLFQAVTDLAALLLSAPRVAQLHGFGEAKQQKGRDASLTAVVSDGTSRPSAWARQVARGLVEVLGEGVRLYPEGAQVLGGTQNAQGRLLQVYERSNFLHLELSSRARKALAAPGQLARLGHVLFVPLED